MALLILQETPAGYGLFQSSIGEEDLAAKLASEIRCPKSVIEMLTLKKFYPFQSSTNAVEEIDALKKGAVPPLLANLLREVQDENPNPSLAMCDPKLGTLLSRVPELNIRAVASARFAELFRGLREHVESVFPNLTKKDAALMAIGLGHSVSRHRLKYRSSVVDRLLTHSAKMLDDVDKECNTYAMKLREWYRWHFPEMEKIVPDNVLYARVVIRVGDCSNLASVDLSDLLDPSVEQQLKTASLSTIGIEASSDDIASMVLLAQIVVNHAETRENLVTWLESRVQAIAPNLTAVVGWLVACKLIAHVGTVMGLTKVPASTIQILGAEKALFRAIKTKHNTPKYGMLYNTSLVGQATGPNKGRIARMLAAKSSLAVRVDCLTEKNAQGSYEERNTRGLEWRIAVEKRLRYLEHKAFKKDGGILGPDGQRIAAVKKPIRG